MKNLFSNIIESSVIRRILIAAAILVVIFILSAEAYHLLEDMTFFEGFYMAFITIATIGFSEITDLSTAGRVLTMVVFLTGIGVISYIASLLTQLLFESEILRKRAMARQLQKIEDHYIVCGYGRIGHRIVEVLQDADIALVVIENQDSSIKRLQDDGLLYVQGNAQEESVLKEAGIEKAKGLVCALSQDQTNVFVTLIARELNEDIFILVRTNERYNTKKIYRAGADRVISPYDIGADRMANVILRPHVNKFINRITGAEQDHVFDEVTVFEDAPLAGKTLAEASIRQKYSVVVIAIASDDGDTDILFNPGRDDTIKTGNSLIVLGDIERIEHLRREGCNDKRNLSERVSNYHF